MREALDSETVRVKTRGTIDVVRGDDEIEIEADERLDEGVHSLPADDAEADALLLEERQKLVEEIRLVHHNHPVKSLGFHGPELTLPFGHT